jgi:hypothetical protein
LFVGRQILIFFKLFHRLSILHLIFLLNSFRFFVKKHRY